MDDAALEKELEKLQREARRASAPDPAVEAPEPSEAQPERRAREPAELPAGFSRKQLVLCFVAAVAVTILLPQVTWGRYVLLPLTFLGTWAHEMGHGLTSLLCGGEFEKLVIYQNLGGTAFTRAPTWARPLVSAGGLLGPALAGGFMVWLGARERVAPKLLAAVALALWLSLALFVRNLVGVVGVATLALALSALARWGPTLVRVFTAQLIGIQLCLASLGTFDYMFTKQFERGGELINSDTQNMAEEIPLFLPYWFYGAVIAALSLMILAAAFYVAWVRPWRRARAAASSGAAA